MPTQSPTSVPHAPRRSGPRQKASRTRAIAAPGIWRVACRKTRRAAEEARRQLPRDNAGMRVDDRTARAAGHARTPQKQDAATRPVHVDTHRGRQVVWRLAEILPRRGPGTPGSRSLGRPARRRGRRHAAHASWEPPCASAALRRTSDARAPPFLPMLKDFGPDEVAHASTAPGCLRVVAAAALRIVMFAGQVAVGRAD